MTKIKLCGLTRPCDIEAVNFCKPDYIGFVFAPKSRRYVSPEKAAELKKHLYSDISAVGVFVNEEINLIAGLLNSGIIDMAQLHGSEEESYIKKLRLLTDKPIIKAFRIDSEQDIFAADSCSADYVLLDSGNGGTGTVFDWRLLQNLKRPYFLAGGLNNENCRTAVETLHPFAVDVSSGIETDGLKDKDKMYSFVQTIRSLK